MYLLLYPPKTLYKTQKKRQTQKKSAYLVLSSLVALVLTCSCQTPESTKGEKVQQSTYVFSDLSPKHPAHSAIQKLRQLGMFSGICTQRSSCEGQVQPCQEKCIRYEARPNQGLSRAEFAALLVKAFGLRPKRGMTVVIRDLGEAKWAKKAIQTVVSLNKMSGISRKNSDDKKKIEVTFAPLSLV
ncbi:MAG: hypothetical protein AAGJ35_08130, partial [Myxococcota bacterium]